MTIDLIELRDLQQIYQRRALAAAGMPEAADYMAHAKRYGAMAETVERFQVENAALALRVKALGEALISFVNWAEDQAMWDKTGQAYYVAKKALSTSDRTSEEAIAEFLGEPVAFSGKDRLTAIRLRCDIQDRHMQYYTPLYSPKVKP